jgi:hypothetical protein
MDASTEILTRKERVLLAAGLRDLDAGRIKSLTQIEKELTISPIPEPQIPHHLIDLNDPSPLPDGLGRILLIGMHWYLTRTEMPAFLGWFASVDRLRRLWEDL